MSTKLGLLLSLIIFLNSFLVIYDLYNVQLVNTNLVLGSNYVNSLILKNGEVNEEVYSYVENKMHGKFYIEDESNIAPCEQLTYTIVVKYKRLYFKDIQEMSITRSVLFGYTLNWKEVK